MLEAVRLQYAEHRRHIAHVAVKARVRVYRQSILFRAKRHWDTSPTLSTVLCFDISPTSRSDAAMAVL